jgi:hypothetical protein
LYIPIELSAFAVGRGSRSNAVEIPEAVRVGKIAIQQFTGVSAVSADINRSCYCKSRNGQHMDDGLGLIEQGPRTVI